MKKLTGRNSGFTLIELIVIIVVLALLSVAAIPGYYDLSGDASQSAEDAVVGTVRSGLALYYSNSVVSGGVPSYPSELDAEENSAEASEEAPLFVAVILGGVTDGWIKSNSTKYEGPTGTIYRYTADTGTFLKQ